MAWLLGFAALCLFAFALLFAAVLGWAAAQDNDRHVKFAVGFCLVMQAAAMALLIAAGMMIGGA